MFSYYDSRDKTAVVAKRMKYFTNAGELSRKTTRGDLNHLAEYLRFVV